MSVKKTVKLTVVTDFVCVSCCITQHELLDAMKYCNEILGLPLNFQLEYIPFRLISPSVLPENPCKPVDREEFLAKHLGTERYAALGRNVSQWAEQKKRPISLSGNMCQSTRAHRLVVKAGRIGGAALQTPLIMNIFAACMEEGKDISDPHVLADIASRSGLGLSEEETIRFIQSDELVKEVEEISNAARAKGITGVPFVIIDGKWAVSGGQSSEVYVQIFKKLATCQGKECAKSPLPAGLSAF